MNESDQSNPKQSWLWGRYSSLCLIVVAATFALDQANKWWMINIYDIGAKGRVEVLPFLDFVYVKNTGISYSLFDQDGQMGQLMLAGFAAVVSLAMWIWQVRSHASRLMALSLGLIIGGALGNAVDRLHLGGVADFYSLHAYGFYWYVFNIADVAIVAGVVGLLYDSIQESRNNAAKHE